MPRSRRGRGEGSVRQRADGTWEARISGGIGRNGKRIRLSAYAKTKAEAIEALANLRDRAGKDLSAAAKSTLEEYLRAWLRDVVAQNSEAATFQTYDVVIRTHIIPGLGHHRLSKLSPTQIQSFYAALGRSGLSKGTTDKIHAVLRRALEHAVDLEVLERNPAAKVKRPKGTVEARPVLSAEQIDRYLEIVAAERLAALFILALFTTMREGEILGLQWSDLDFAARAISVRHARKKQRVVDPKTGKAKYTYGLGAPKTAKSRRRIQMAQIVYEALQMHRKRMMAEGHASKFVFCGIHGKPIGPSNLRTRLHYPILEKAGLPRVTFHDLRHSAATVLLEQGVHPKIAQEMLGHSSSRITMDRYSHALPTMQQAAVNAIDARFGGLDRYSTPILPPNESKNRE